MSNRVFPIHRALKILQSVVPLLSRVHEGVAEPIKRELVSLCCEISEKFDDQAPSESRFTFDDPEQCDFDLDVDGGVCETYYPYVQGGIRR